MNALYKAAQSLPGHWHQGDYADGRGNYCAAGHWLKAIGYTDKQMDFAEPETDEDTNAMCALLNKVAIELFPDRGFQFIAEVNDHPDTTEEDMVTVLEKAAVRWDERVV